MPFLFESCNPTKQFDAFSQITSSLSNEGWCIVPEFIPPLFVSQLRKETEDLWANGSCRQAGIGSGDCFKVDRAVRTDLVKWLDPLNCSITQQFYLDELEKLRLEINRTLFLGLFDLESHFSIYPPGGHYRKHFDRFQTEGLRTLTCILYLNADWTMEDGGQLRIYTDSDNGTSYEEILPTEGKLVCFLSERFLHEVLPSRRTRLSLTSWFKARG